MDKFSCNWNRYLIHF